MKVLFYECFSGISGDLNLGAMLDLGVDLDYLLSELSKLGIDDEFAIQCSIGQKMGIHGTRVDVVLHNQNDHQHTHSHESAIPYSHSPIQLHTHSEEDLHSHMVFNSKGHHSHHEHTHSHGRTYSEIQVLMEKSDLTPQVKKVSLEIFEKIALAEAKVHNQAVENVHFHEVGATDSIVDIVGAAICFDALDVDMVISSPIELGSGFVWCQHGKLPVPAPATSEILKGIKCTRGGVSGEATTPTGAAIITTLAEEFSTTFSMNIEKIGYGIGFKDFEIPNVLRVSIGSIDESTKNDLIISKERIIETNLDDMNPELIPFIEEELLKIGALDVFRSPIQMKKGRSGVKLSILVDEKNQDQILDYLFTQTSTFGVRSYVVDKMMMQREIEVISTEYGEVRIKKAIFKGKVVKYKPEFEDIKRISIYTKLPINDVQKKILFYYEQIR